MNLLVNITIMMKLHEFVLLLRISNFSILFCEIRAEHLQKNYTGEALKGARAATY